MNLSKKERKLLKQLEGQGILVEEILKKAAKQLKRKGKPTATIRDTETLKYEKDPDKELDKFFEHIRNRNFLKLFHARINYIFRTTFKKDDEGREVAGEAKKLSARERDLYGYDFEICVHKDTWEHASKREKKRLAWHELNHLIVKTNKEGKPLYDKAERLKISLRRHDIVIKTFLEELNEFGPTAGEREVIDQLYQYAKGLRRKKRVIKRRK